jgi:hypothetical protein
MTAVRRAWSHSSIAWALLAVCTAAQPGCGPAGSHRPTPIRPTHPVVFVVAPVSNLSNSGDVDPLKITDWVASECVSFPGVSVIPVNLTLAALAEQGRTRVETPEEALDLAARFNADATLITALTEFNPYDPPIVGLVMQAYIRSYDEPGAAGPPPGPDLGRAAAGGVEPASWEARATVAPLQVQRVFNGSHDDVNDEVRAYAGGRDGHASPFGWRRYLKSQELFVRYSCWSAFRTMLCQSPRLRAVAGLDEVQGR